MTSLMSRLIWLASLVSVVVSGCAVNPATGQRQLSLIDEQQEIAMGKEAHQQILKTMPLYGDSALQDYVSGLGHDLARRTERPELPWTFVVLDDASVNAFAIPGGHVYVTRGILGYMNTEAELASVLGHEIGHVTARHSVEQMSKQQLLGLGLGIGALVSPEFARYGDLAQAGAGLLLLKYSRADEAQADHLGLRYMMQGGYDGREMPKVFRTLERVSEADSNGQRLPNWLSTHPAPENRFASISAEIDRLGGRDGKVERARYLEHVDGITFGADPRQGYFRGQHFYHPQLRFQLTFPDGWKTSNEVERVAASSSEGDAAVQLTLADKPDARSAVEAFASREGVEGTAAQATRLHGLDGYESAFSLQSQGRALRGEVLYLDFAGHVYQLVALGVESSWNDRSAAAEQALHSFAPLTEARYLNVSPARIELVKAARTMTAEELRQAYDSTVDAQTLAIINELASGQRVTPGETAKVVTGGKLPE